MRPTDVADAAPLIDANLLLWAHHEELGQHQEARRWWTETLTTAPRVGVPWPSVLAFLRISTHPRVLTHPATIGEAWAIADEWLARPNVWTPLPTDRHARVLASMLLDGDSRGHHTTDAHLAALAVEWGLELLTADRGFARYPGLRWRNPLQT